MGGDRGDMVYHRRERRYDRRERQAYHNLQETIVGCDSKYRLHTTHTAGTWWYWHYVVLCMVGICGMDVLVFTPAGMVVTPDIVRNQGDKYNEQCGTPVWHPSVAPIGNT